MGARILVIEDEPQILRSVRLILTGHGYDVTTAMTAKAGVDEFLHRLPDLVLLDLMLPDMPGEYVCRKIRERSSTPIVVLSARGEEASKVEAFDLGADDYLTKPFGAGELLARIRVALRHAGGATLAATVTVGNITIDFDQRSVRVGEQPVQLTPREYDVLKYLVQNRDRVLTHANVIRAVWGPEYATEAQYLRNIVLGLRRKLEADPSRPRYLLTEPGIGYRLTSPPESPGEATVPAGQ
ncbi:MAG: response regulator transcription factor [Dehalococcoidia bacterium]|nr:response regulator transcription factor [Dehalococcoidia bacterium]